MPLSPDLLARLALFGAAFGSALAVLPPAPAAAQPAGPPTADASAEGAAVPAPPAEAPPAPARLSPIAGPLLPPPPERPLALPAGMEALPGGGWRIRFAPGRESLPDAATATLAELGRRLAGRPQGRITLLAQAGGPETDLSIARRLSLARALAVKAALAAGGLPPTRIDLRPQGRTEEAVDAVDVTPPEALAGAR